MRPTAQPNRSLATVANLSAPAKQAGKKGFADWHWTTPDDAAIPIKMINCPDPDYPDTMIECGRLIRFHVRLPPSGNKKNPKRERDSMIEFSRRVSDDSHLAFDPAHPRQRLYVILSERVRPAVAERFFHENPAQVIDLNTIARLAGGAHGRMGGYPDIDVKPIGILTAVVYFTHKKEDGPSYYIHKMAEQSGYFPILCADAAGRLWIAGSNATSPTPGITD